MSVKKYTVEISVKVSANSDGDVLLDVPSFKYPNLRFEEMVLVEKALSDALAGLSGLALQAVTKS